MLPALLTEARRRRVAMGVIFATIAIALGIGLVWPKKYEASTTILPQESSIITPLMEGAASPRQQEPRGHRTRRDLQPQACSIRFCAVGGWMEQRTAARWNRTSIIEGIKSRTKVQTSRGQPDHHQLLRLRPEAYVSRSHGSSRSLFISESLASKQRESREAYEFINSQVEAYRHKLTDAEDKLKAYRDANADARPGSDRTPPIRASASCARRSKTTAWI
jgi:hypothetical protein